MVGEQSEAPGIGHRHLVLNVGGAGDGEIVALDAYLLHFDPLLHVHSTLVGVEDRSHAIVDVSADPHEQFGFSVVWGKPWRFGAVVVAGKIESIFHVNCRLQRLLGDVEDAGGVHDHRTKHYGQFRSHRARVDENPWFCSS